MLHVETSVQTRAIVSTDKRVKHAMKNLAIFFAWVVLVAGCGEQPDELPEAAVPSTTDMSLLSAREGFQTKIIANSFRPDGPPDQPPESEFNVTHYPAEDGDLVAYITPDPGDGNRHPAIIWAHGGFGGIGSWLWEQAPEDDDQSVRAFLDAGIVTMCPSWRGENSNPGRFELFFGEVDDLIDALSHLKSLPYVDPGRVYLAGHSTGGTLALLASVSTDQFRAVFSLGGAPDIAKVVEDGSGYGNTPFNYQIKDEAFYRSATNFAHLIRSPTFYFEGENSFYCDDALRMQSKAAEYGVPLKAFIIKDGTHFNIIAPITKLIAKKITEDTSTVCSIEFRPNELKLR